jgi:hypothetical protein
VIRPCLDNWLIVDLPSEKYEFVSWDGEIPNICFFLKKTVPNHQPVFYHVDKDNQVALGYSLQVAAAFWHL